ncbi:MAG: PQQ-like beta-propeller repeat protein, partial [Spirochaetota bacterium]|nr:PQQ-like beta-propeller repeat protein [Spirochaetota bacterium]
FASTKGTVYTININDAKLVRKIEKVGNINAHSKIHITEKSILVVSGKALMSLNKLNGKKLWIYNANDVISFSPVGNKDRIFISSKYTTHAIKTADGTRLWKTDWDGKAVAQSIFTDNTLVIFTDKGIAGIDITKGSRPKWSFNDYIVRSHPFYKDGFIYVGTDEGNLLKINVKTGKLIWNIQINLVDIHLSGNNKYLFIAFNRDEFIIMDYTKGQEVNRYEGVRNDFIIYPIMSGDSDKSIFFFTKGLKLYKDSVN